MESRVIVVSSQFHILLSLFTFFRRHLSLSRFISIGEATRWCGARDNKTMTKTQSDRTIFLARSPPIHKSQVDSLLSTLLFFLCFPHSSMSSSSSRVTYNLDLMKTIFLLSPPLNSLFFLHFTIDDVDRGSVARSRMRDWFCRTFNWDSCQFWSAWFVIKSKNSFERFERPRTRWEREKLHHRWKWRYFSSFNFRFSLLPSKTLCGIMNILDFITLNEF